MTCPVGVTDELATRPRLLDLCCKAGGCSRGYDLAGFDVLGVDIEPQLNYPYPFLQADVTTLPLGFIRQFAAAHASPPCQRYIRGGLAAKDGRHPDLLPVVRRLLIDAGIPWVIENVPGAPMRPDVVLCGSMFGLEVRRHRWFEFSSPVTALTPPCDHSKPVAGVYGNPHGKSGAWPGMLPSDLATWSRAMGIDWMTTAELADAIPPAYCEFIGAELLLAASVSVGGLEQP